MTPPPADIARSHVLQVLARFADHLAERNIPPNLPPEDDEYLRAWVRESRRIAERLRASPGFRMEVRG